MILSEFLIIFQTFFLSLCVVGISEFLLRQSRLICFKMSSGLNEHKFLFGNSQTAGEKNPRTRRKSFSRRKVFLDLKNQWDLWIRVVHNQEDTIRQTRKFSNSFPDHSSKEKFRFHFALVPKKTSILSRTVASVEFFPIFLSSVFFLLTKSTSPASHISSFPAHHL